MEGAQAAYIYIIQLIPMIFLELHSGEVRLFDREWERQQFAPDPLQQRTLAD
jgi:hypothetical protein